MVDDEPALLHQPDLMLAILRAAHHAPASLHDVMAQLPSNLAAAHEPLLSQRAIRAAGSNVGAASEAPTRLQLPATTGFVLPHVVPGCSTSIRMVSTSCCCRVPRVSHLPDRADPQAV